jgi:hypothetical protein
LQEQISAPAGQSSARAPRHPNPRLSIASRFLENWLNSYEQTNRLGINNGAVLSPSIFTGFHTDLQAGVQSAVFRAGFPDWRKQVKIRTDLLCPSPINGFIA